MRKKLSKSITEFVQDVVLIFKFIYKIHKSFIYISIPQIALQVIEPLILAIFSKLIFDELTISLRFNILIRYILYITISMIIVRVLLALLLAKVKYHTDILTHKINLEISRNIMHIDYMYLEQSDMRNTFQLASDSKNVISSINSFINILTYIFQIIAVSAIIIHLSFVIIVLIALTLSIKIAGENKANKAWKECRQLVAPLERKGIYISNFGTDHSGAKEVRLNNLRKWLLDKALKISNECNDKFLKQYKITSAFQTLTHAAYALQTGVTYVILVIGVVSNKMTIGDFSMYLAAINTLSQSLSSITSAILDLRKNSSYINDYKNVLNIKVKSKTNGVHIDGSLSKDEIRIKFENVFFKYPNSEKYVLKNINIEIQPQEKLSIVGLNGAGKTTFIKLLCGLYEPTKGRILCNDIDISTIKYDDYIKMISVVFQDFKIFSFSLAENIALNKKIDKEDMELIIDKAGLMEKYKTLKNGLETFVYKEFDDDGVEFSGGEMQKVAIARALYRKTPIVILDEPTASLDPIAEYEIYSKFNEIASSKTTIFISHRLSSTRFSDKIAVFSAGEIVEYGSHEELNNLNGLYAEMFKKQAQYYVK